MKATGIVLTIVAVLLLAGSLFYGYFSYRNSGSAERLGMRLPSGAGFVVRMVENKARNQRNLALMLGGPGVIALGVGIVLMKKGKRAA
jgi:hypothetical protein